MSTTAKILCKNCDNHFEIYWNAMPSQIKCPHCLSEMSENMVKQVRNAIGTVHDVNAHFRKYHSEREESLFEVSIQEIYVPTHKVRL